MIFEKNGLHFKNIKIPDMAKKGGDEIKGDGRKIGMAPKKKKKQDGKKKRDGEKKRIGAA